MEEPVSETYASECLVCWGCGKPLKPVYYTTHGEAKIVRRPMRVGNANRDPYHIYSVGELPERDLADPDSAPAACVHRSEWDDQAARWYVNRQVRPIASGRFAGRFQGIRPTRWPYFCSGLRAQSFAVQAVCAATAGKDDGKKPWERVRP